jgi:integrase
MLPESPRSPCPITWEEQNALFQRLPGHLQRMALFAVDTGARKSNICGLRWTWEAPVPEVGRSVFAIPPAAFKFGRSHVMTLNDAAWSIVQTQRGLHPDFVFVFRKKPVRSMNTAVWKNARRGLELPQVRIHDLRHTFAAKLRAADVSAEDRAALLGHACSSMPAHYASADIGRLIRLANRVLGTDEHAHHPARGNGLKPTPVNKSPAKVPQAGRRPGFEVPSP